MLCALDSTSALSLGSQCTAICASPSLVEINFVRAPLEIRSVELYVNGALKKTQAYLKNSCLSVISSEQLKPTDQIFIKIYDGIDFEGNPLNIPLSRVYGSFIHDGSLRGFLGQNRINPLSTNPDYRNILNDSNVIQSGVIYDWTPPLPSVFSSTGTLTSRDPEYIRVFLDNQDSSLSRVIFEGVATGRHGEELTLTVQFRANTGVMASAGIHVTNMVGHIYSGYATAHGTGSWETLKVIYTLEATGPVTISLYAAETSDHTKNLDNQSCEVDFKNVLVTSNWRQTSFRDPLIFPNLWSSSGIAVPGLDVNGTKGFASWLDIFPNGINDSLVLLTGNTLSFAVSETVATRAKTTLSLLPTSITLMSFNAHNYTYVDPVSIRLYGSTIGISINPQSVTLQSEIESVLMLMDQSSVTLVSSETETGAYMDPNYVEGYVE